MNATIKNFTVDGNLVAKEISGEVVSEHKLFDTPVVRVDLGDWGKLLFDAGDPDLVVHRTATVKNFKAETPQGVWVS